MVDGAAPVRRRLTVVSVLMALVVGAMVGLWLGGSAGSEPQVYPPCGGEDGGPVFPCAVYGDRPDENGFYVTVIYRDEP